MTTVLSQKDTTECQRFVKMGLHSTHQREECPIEQMRKEAFERHQLWMGWPCECGPMFAEMTKLQFGFATSWLINSATSLTRAQFSSDATDAVLRVSLQNCWQVPGHYHLLTDTTSTSTCQTSLTSLHNTRGTGFSMQLQPGKGLRDNKPTLKAFKLSA